MTNTESARALYARTRQERFALGAFNVDNQETLTAIARAAAARKSPVLVEASHGEVEMIHIDLSQAKRDATDEEIIAATREVVEYAKTTGACVESEPHYF